MTDTSWLIFLPQLPSKPSSLRVSVWRQLKSAGAVNLQGVWVLPQSTETESFLKRMLIYIKDENATAYLFAARDLTEGTREEIIAQFQSDRAQEYEEFLEQTAVFLEEIEKETHARKFTFAELEENEHSLQRLKDWLTKIQERDYFELNLERKSFDALNRCQVAFTGFTHNVYEREGIDFPLDAGIEQLDSQDTDEGRENDKR